VFGHKCCKLKLRPRLSLHPFSAGDVVAFLLLVSNKTKEATLHGTGGTVLACARLSMSTGISFKSIWVACGCVSDVEEFTLRIAEVLLLSSGSDLDSNTVFAKAQVQRRFLSCTICCVSCICIKWILGNAAFVDWWVRSQAHVSNHCVKIMQRRAPFQTAAPLLSRLLLSTERDLTMQCHSREARQSVSELSTFAASFTMVAVRVSC